MFGARWRRHVLLTVLLGSGLGGHAERAASAPAAGLSAGTELALPWWRAGVGYEIFVRSFQDSDGDGIGDLEGVRQRLGYLKGLGVTMLWLMPIFPSPSYHGYDVADYQAINPDYGTLASFKALLEGAHAQGLRVILDIPLNHSSSKHPWFLAAASDRNSAMRQRYVFKDSVPDWPAQPDNAAHWHKVDEQFFFAFFNATMPDLNWTSEEVYADMLSAMSFWVRLGVDGFRLDAARYLVEGPKGETDTAATHAVWQRLAKDLKAVNPGTMLVGEVWADQGTINAYYGDGKELDQCFAFPVAGGLVSSLKAGNAGDFTKALQVLKAAPAFFSSPFLTNHDQVRIATTVPHALAKLRLGAAALLTLPGMPYLYYGEELGLPDGMLAAHKGDLAKRTPMPWDFKQGNGRGFTTAAAPWLPFSSDDAEVDAAAEDGEATSLLQTYRRLIALRTSEPALADGNFLLLPAPKINVVAFSRQTDDTAVVSFLNFGAKAQSSLTVKLPWTGDEPTASVLYGDGAVAGVLKDGSLTVTLSELSGFGATIVRVGGGK